MAEEVCGQAADGGARAEEDEEVEAEHGGREQDGEGGDGFDQGTPGCAGGGEPERKRDAECEEERGGDDCKAEGERKGLEIHLANGLEALRGEALSDLGRLEEFEKTMRG